MKKAVGFIQDCVEKYIPTLGFIILFVVFLFQLVVRYAISKYTNLSVPWTVEVEQSCFLWLVLLGACYAQRVKGHVTFTLLYDNLGIKGKAITAMLGNILITFTFLITLFPSFHYIWGLTERQQMTTLLKWPKTAVFMPYVIFLVIILLYTVIEMYEEIRVLAGDQAAIDRMLAQNKSEAEQAIEASLSQEDLDLNNIDYDGKGDR